MSEPPPTQPGSSPSPPSTAPLANNSATATSNTAAIAETPVDSSSSALAAKTTGWQQREQKQQQQQLPQRQAHRQHGKDLMSEGLVAGQRIARISVITLVSIGIAEIAMGQISGSVVATADGIDSLSDAMISFIVLLGLRIAHKPADKKFHFGYHKVESFAALIAAIGMVAIGGIIMYHSYEALLHPREIQHPVPTMVVLAAAGAVSLHRAFQMNSVANKYNLLSLKTDAKNSIKDGSASVIGFASVLVATQFGFLQMDAIGGMVIACYIFSISYISLKQSSLILVDSWQNPRITDAVRRVVEDKFREQRVKVRSVLIRPAGNLAQAEVHLEIDGQTKLADVEMLLLNIEMAIRSQIPIIGRITSIPHSYLAPKTESASPPSKVSARRFGVFGEGRKEGGGGSAASNNSNNNGNGGSSGSNNSSSPSNA